MNTDSKSRAGGARTRRWTVIAGLTAASLLFALTGIAAADTVTDDVTSTAAGKILTVEAGQSATVRYTVNNTNNNNDEYPDTQNNCNLNGSNTDLRITPGGMPPGVSAPEATAQSCGDPVSITFSVGSGVSAGNYPIIHRLTPVGATTGDFYNLADFTLRVTSAPPSDTTAPTIEPNISGTPGDNGWYTSNVTLTWSVVDNESAISSTTGCDAVNITADQAATTYTCSATSAGGPASESVTIKRDATKPTLNPSVSPNPVLLNGAATASANASDNLSGVASSSCDPVDTSSVGSKSVSCSATDNAGNTNGASESYSVAYQFVGFSSPVDNNGVLNVAKAGQAIPLKWRLLDANDNPVTNLSSVKVTVASLACSSGTTADLVEEYAAGSSGLQNLGDGYYQFNWKTPTSYANSCKTMNLDLGEGPHTALFQFRK